MNLVKSIFLKLSVEFVYGGHLLSLGASGIVMTVILLLGLPINFIILAISYLGSQIIYTYNHYKELGVDILSNPERSQHILQRSNFIKLSLIFYSVVLIILLALTNIPTILFILFIVLFGILYTEGIKNFFSKYLLGFKNIYTSFFWALIILVVPIYYGLDLELFFIYFFIFVLLRWIVNSTFFDIKDIESDKKLGLKTMAVYFGKNKTIMILQLINLLSLIPLLLGILNKVIPLEGIILIFFIIYGTTYLIVSQNIQKKDLRTLSYIVVDGEYIFWPIILIIGEIIFKL